MTSDGNVLTVRCPFCGHEHVDDYECLDSGRADVLGCENTTCRKQFSFLIGECTECGEESVFTWTGMPAPETLALLSCNYCGAPFHETTPEGQGADPARRI